MRAVALALLLAGCGRLGFDSQTSALTDARGDSRADAPTDALADSSDAAALCSALYCDDFEAASFDPRWMLDTFHGTLALDTFHAHSGAQSVHAHTDSIAMATTNVRATLLSYDALPVTGTIYVRMWVFFANQPTGFFNQVINLADAPGNGMSTGFKDGFIANNDYTAPTQYTQSAVTMQPLDAWTCLMFSMPSGVTGTSRVWLGGTEDTDIAQTIAAAQPQPTHVYLGTEWVGTPTSLPATDMWLDDVAVDTAPVTCN